MVAQSNKRKKFTLAIYGYTRVSRDNEGESLDVQRRQLEGFCVMKGWQLDWLYVERSISGSIAVSERPEGGAMWRALADGDVILAPKLDRLFRSALDALQTVSTLNDRGIKLHLLDLGFDALGNGHAKLFLTIAAAFAEAERDRIRERIGASKADQRAKGQYLGGKVPFGFRVVDGVLAPDPAEQRALLLIRGWRRDGSSLADIRTSLQAATGFSVAISTLHRICKESAPE